MYENLLTRRSVRKYQDRQVEEELLDKVLQAGLYAPTAKNNQKPVMVAVRDKATRDQLSRMNAAVMGVDSDPFYGAPCVIVVLADPEYPTWIDAGSLVLGCVVVRRAFAEEHPAEIAKFLEEYEASINYLSEDTAAAAQMIVDAGIFAQAPVAQKAIPNCNLCFIAGADMQPALGAFLDTMFQVAAPSVGGAVPADDFYYVGQ